MTRFTSDPSGRFTATTVEVRFGPGVVVGLLAACLGFWACLGLWGGTPAAAATLVPCERTQPSGPIVTVDGEGTLTPVRATRRMLKRSRVKQRLIRPANRITGRPEFPVRAVRYGKPSKVHLKGGIRFSRGRRALKVKNLVVLVPAREGRAAVVVARIGRGLTPLFRIKGGFRVRKSATGTRARVRVINRGRAQLTAKAARELNRKLKLRGKRKFRAGATFGRLDLYALHSVVRVKDPEAETPEEPPVTEAPAGAKSVLSATIKWYPRETWIDYVSSGFGTYVADGATADPPPGENRPAYSFNFQPDLNDPGWVQPGVEGESPQSSLIKGKGTVGFRFCWHTINFTVSDPEIELDGDNNSRMIFRVNGTDGTHFPNSRAVIINLKPDQADPVTSSDNGDGTVKVEYRNIPGYVPAEATEIFAGLYSAYTPFGSLDLTYTYDSSDDPN